MFAHRQGTEKQSLFPGSRAALGQTLAFAGRFADWLQQVTDLPYFLGRAVATDLEKRRSLAPTTSRIVEMTPGRNGSRKAKVVGTMCRAAGWRAAASQRIS